MSLRKKVLGQLGATKLASSENSRGEGSNSVYLCFSENGFLIRLSKRKKGVGLQQNISSVDCEDQKKKKPATRFPS